MPERVLITGGAGYIGSILAPHLLDQGYHVTVLDAFYYRQNSLLDCCANERFSIVRGDCRDREILSKLVRHADAIIPLAALVGAPLCDRDPLGARSVNLDAILLLNELRSPSQKLLIPITNSGYGVGEDGKFCTEDTPLRPISIYGRTKAEAERALLDAGNVISFRLATVFGASPRMRTDLLVNDFVYRAVFDRVVVLFEGHFKRNYIHVRDVARVFQHGLEHYQAMRNRPYNVGLSDANLSKVELCARIKAHFPDFVYVESTIGQDPDKRDYIVSNERIESTGWRPAFTLDHGIKELAKAFTIVKNNAYANV